MMLALSIAVPFVGCLVLAVMPRASSQASRAIGVVASATSLALLIVTWTTFDPGGPLFQHVVDYPWIAEVGVGFRLGIDGIALALAATTALLFTVAIVYPVDHRGRAGAYVAWMLFLQAACIGLFTALDLLLFYVFFDVSLVGMYFLIALWGHDNGPRAALKFILYTLAGSLVMLLGILSLALAHDPITFDMRVLIDEQPLAAMGARSTWTLLALMIGLAIKTPLVPVHTWLPPAHVEAPAPASTILAGVMLKMGTFGMIRIAFSMMHATFRQYSGWVVGFGVLSIVYGALVALGQTHIKRRIAYTSITHMGYTVLGLGAAATAATVPADARRLAMTGAALEMVAHALITGALFLIAGSLWQRTHEFEMNAYGGVVRSAPRLTAAATIAAFASLGLPGLAGFVAEFQIFTGALALTPWAAGIALLGVLLTAALFLQFLQQVFFGEPSQATRGVSDIRLAEGVGLVLLLGLTVAIGVYPAFVVEILDATSGKLLQMH